MQSDREMAASTAFPGISRELLKLITAVDIRPADDVWKLGQRLALSRENFRNPEASQLLNLMNSSLDSSTNTYRMQK